MIRMLMTHSNRSQMARRRVRIAPEREDISYWQRCILMMRTSRRRTVRMRAHTTPERADESYSLWRIRTVCIFVTRTMVRVRMSRLIQRDAVSRTTMLVHIPTQPGANLRRRTVEMGAPDVVIAAEDPCRQMRTTPARKCVVVSGVTAY